MKKICFLGGPSTGKTALAIELVKELVKRKYRVKLVKEYALDYHKKHKPQSVADQYFILLGQRAREKKAESQNPDFVVCDGSQIHSFVYQFLYLPSPKNKKSYNRHEMIARLVKEEVWKDIPSYDYVFFLPLEFKAKKAKGRQYLNRRKEISFRIRAFLDTYLWKDCYLWKKRKRPSWHVIRGNLEQRVSSVLEIVLKPS